MNRHNSNNDAGTIINAIGSNGTIGLEPLIKEPILLLAAAREAGQTGKRYPGGVTFLLGVRGVGKKLMTASKTMAASKSTTNWQVEQYPVAFLPVVFNPLSLTMAAPLWGPPLWGGGRV